MPSISRRARVDGAAIKPLYPAGVLMAGQLGRDERGERPSPGFMLPDAPGLERPPQAEQVVREIGPLERKSEALDPAPPPEDGSPLLPERARVARTVLEPADRDVRRAGRHGD